MKSFDIVQKIREIAIVPVVRTNNADSAIRAVEAISSGGIACAEITMTVKGAIRALEQVADRFGDKILLGAGTVLDPETARACMLAGANFFVTPSLNRETIALALTRAKDELAAARTPAHKRMLANAIAALEQQLASRS